MHIEREHDPFFDVPADTVRSIGVVVVKNGKVLLVRHKEAAQHVTDTYGLPSGRIEPDETAPAAAVRELAEETGLTATEEDMREYPNNMYFAAIDRKDGNQKRFAWVVFFCTHFEGLLMESPETIPEWVSLEQVSSLNLLPNVDEAIQDALKHNSEFRFQNS